MRVFLSAGEASGDAYAAALARGLIARLPDVTCEGVGGVRLAQVAKGEMVDSSKWGAVSIVQSLMVAPRAFAGYLRAKKMLRTGAPGLLIPIDFGFFNIRIAGYAKGLGWKVLYFVPPGSWRRDRQGKDLANVADEIVVPFPWAVGLLEAAGARAHFFGHPLKSLIAVWRLGDPDTTKTRGIAVLPGSRKHEIDRNLPLMAKVARGLPETTIEFAVAPTADLERMKADWRRLAPDRQDAFTQGDVYGVLSRAKAAIVCSGTATLEAALLRCPMVVVYRVSRIVKAEATIIGFKQPEFISLPNIVLNRRLVPEHVGVEIDTSLVTAEVQALMNPSEARREQLEGFVEIDGILGDGDAIVGALDLAIGMLR